MDSGGLQLTISASALISVPLVIYLSVMMWKISRRTGRIEKMLLHQEYRKTTQGDEVVYVPELTAVPEDDPDAVRIRELREARRRELQEMGIDE